MIQVTLTLPSETALFYSRIATLTNKPMNTVLSDALFLLAGELSLEALHSATESTVDSQKL